jgi:hypothetical protein
VESISVDFLEFLLPRKKSYVVKLWATLNFTLSAPIVMVEGDDIVTFFVQRSFPRNVNSKRRKTKNTQERVMKENTLHLYLLNS